MSKKMGKVFLVGAGPGDIGLLTRRAEAVLRKADVVVYDYLVSPLAVDLAPPDAERIYVGKKGGGPFTPQEEISSILADRAKKGLLVVRLKGGDPFVFGRGGEEAVHLAEQGIPFEVVPGITSAVAVPAYAGVPVTYREYNSELVIFTGHEDPTKERSSIDWKSLAQGRRTLVMLMGVSKLSENLSELIKYGMSPDMPAVLISRGTTCEQKTSEATVGTLADIAEKEGISAPAVCVIGEVAALRSKLKWFENSPLFGKKILVTRPESGAFATAEKLSALGADVAVVPAVEIRPRPKDNRWKEFSAAASKGGWIFFTSANAVKVLFDMLLSDGLDSRWFGNLKIVSIGPKTSLSLEEIGLRADFTAPVHTAEGILKIVGDRVKGERCFLPRSSGARQTLKDGLLSAGAEVFEYFIYDAVVPEGAADKLKEIINNYERLDWITFASASTAHHFMKLAGGMPKGAKAASIGPITTSALREYNIEPAAEAEVYTIDGLIEAMIEFEKGR